MRPKLSQTESLTRWLALQELIRESISENLAAKEERVVQAYREAPNVRMGGLAVASREAPGCPNHGEWDCDDWGPYYVCACSNPR